MSQLCSSLGSAHLGSNMGTFSSLGNVTSREGSELPHSAHIQQSPQTQSLDPVPVWSQWGAEDPPVCSSSPQSVPLRASLHHFPNLFLQVLQTLETPCNSRLSSSQCPSQGTSELVLRGRGQSPSLFAGCPLSWGWDLPAVSPDEGVSWDNLFQSGSFVFSTVSPASGNVLLPSGVCLGIFIEKIQSFLLARHNPSCAGLLPNPALPVPLPIPATPGVHLSLSPSIPRCEQSWGWHFHCQGCWSPLPPGKVDLGEE